eukprot:CAMPEP_0201590756 /NCGR_PEP_ID=MMETSP0190_2-20130828/181459_1 /ASSEMBLY_ACC=CAM_ASM_000263 /TAXON_ID=37353 /ORGANISM="Rosalina sp." /LENGTH=426 /DNA_ID=CAMNT_0048047553 /DNA_START=71 /DNA_END=1347 /DNA_ORIENTATION=-
MNIFSIVLCAGLAYGYNITFGPKNNFFATDTVENPYSNYLFGQNGNNVLLICYEDKDIVGRNGQCELGQIDITNQKITFSNESVFDTKAIDNYEIQLLGPNGPLNNFLIGYTNGADSSTGPGKVVLGSFDTTTNMIKYGAPVTFNVGDNDQSNVVELERNDSYFAVCYSIGPNDNKGTGCRIGQYDVTDLSVRFGQQLFNVPSNGPTDGMGISRINNESIIVCYAESQGNGNGVCVIGMIDDLVDNGLNAKITFGTPVVFNNQGGTDEIKFARVYRGNRNSTDDPFSDFVICYVTSVDGACSYLDLDQDANGNIELILRSRAAFAPRDSIDQPSIARIPANTTGLNNQQELLLVCYVDVGIDEDAECIFGTVDVVGKKLAFDTSQDNISQFEDGRTDRINVLYLGGNSIVICYVDINGAPITNDGP